MRTTMPHHSGTSNTSAVKQSVNTHFYSFIKQAFCGRERYPTNPPMAQCQQWSQVACTLLKVMLAQSTAMLGGGQETLSMPRCWCFCFNSNSTSRSIALLFSKVTHSYVRMGSCSLQLQHFTLIGSEMHWAEKGLLTRHWWLHKYW